MLDDGRDDHALSRGRRGWQLSGQPRVRVPVTGNHNQDPTRPVEPTLVIEFPQTLSAARDVHMRDDGTFVALDIAPPRLLLFDQNGTMSRSSVEGRLERVLHRVLDDGSGRLLVPDVLHHRIDVYDGRTLDLVDEISTNPNDGMPLGFASDGLGRLYQMVGHAPAAGFGLPTSGGEGAGGWRIMVLESGVFRELLEISAAHPPGGVFVAYAPRPAWSVLRNGVVAVANGVKGRLDLYRDGRLERSVPAPELGPPIPPQDQRVLAGIIREEESRLAELFPVLAFRKTEPRIADRYPAFMQILCDDRERVWFRLPAYVDELRGLPPRVAAHAVDHGSSHWMVQELAGGRRWKVSFSAGFELTRVRNDLAIGFLDSGGHAGIQVHRIASGGLLS